MADCEENMDWKIDENLPIWAQLVSRIAEEIAAGHYPPGERLPSVRDLAADAGVNPNTMQRALSELEAKGLLITNRTAGRTVTSDAARIEALRREKAKKQVNLFLQKMQQLGYSAEDTEQLFRAGMVEIYPHESK